MNKAQKVALTGKQIGMRYHIETEAAPVPSSVCSSGHGKAKEGGVSAHASPPWEVLSMFKRWRKTPLRLLKYWPLDALVRFPRSDGVCCIEYGQRGALALSILQEQSVNKTSLFVETCCKCFKIGFYSIMHVITRN